MTGDHLYDQVVDSRFYIKYDTKNGALLFGDLEKNSIIGFYQDEARVNPNEYTKLLVPDPTKDLLTAAQKLARYHGLADATVPLAGTFSSNAKIVADPNKTTTIVGAFKVEDGKIIYMDMPAVFENFGNLKTNDFGPKPGGFNVLNVGDAFYEPGSFFNKYNRPWLEEAIRRGDNFVAASDPRKEIFIFERDKITKDWVMITDASGASVRKRTGFGKEVEILEQNGYVYDAATAMFKKP
jgi:hypothetical protein